MIYDYNPITVGPLWFMGENLWQIIFAPFHNIKLTPLRKLEKKKLKNAEADAGALEFSI